jgi:hypothetical protein
MSININDIIVLDGTVFDIDNDTAFLCVKTFNFGCYLGRKSFVFTEGNLYSKRFIESLYIPITKYTIRCTMQGNVFQEIDTCNIVTPNITLEEVCTQAQHVIIYKTQEKLQGADGNNIRKGSKMTKEEIESLGLSLGELLEEEKIIEVKIIK